MRQEWLFLFFLGVLAVKNLIHNSYYYVILGGKCENRLHDEQTAFALRYGDERCCIQLRNVVVVVVELPQRVRPG